jgi:hypothetical protein
VGLEPGFCFRIATTCHLSGSRPIEAFRAKKAKAVRLTRLRVCGPKRPRFEYVDAMKCRTHNVTQLAAVKVAYFVELAADEPRKRSSTEMQD